MALAPALRINRVGREHRSDLAELRRLADQDLDVVFRQFDTADEIRDGLQDLLPSLMQTYGSASASLAADFYDDLRDASGVRGRFQAIVAELPDLGRVDSLARWAVTPLYGDQTATTTAMAKVSGGFQRIIYNADRDTIVQSSVQDQRAGWVRVGNGGCDWCEQFLDGEVHHVDGYDFDAHDDCQCIALPVFE